jgi:serine O-acetyltransferase
MISWSDVPRRRGHHQITLRFGSCYEEFVARRETGVNLPLRDILRADAYRYCGRLDRRAMLGAYLRHPGFRFTYYLRKVAFYSTQKRSLGIFAYVYYRIWLHRYRFRYGFDISPTTSIGPGLYIGHFGGVVISPQALLGANINIAQGVTIGATSRGARVGAPTLEDRVWVGANAILVGKITIGREALIAPGAYVNFDVPSQAVVMGNPGKIVSNAGSQGYVNNTMNLPGISWKAEPSVGEGAHRKASGAVISDHAPAGDSLS